MKNVLKAFGIISMVLIIGFSMAACDDGSDSSSVGGGGGGGGIGGPQTATYTGKSGDATYTLKITENTERYTAQIGDAYELIFRTKKNTGTVSNVEGGKLTLTPSNDLTLLIIAIISGNNLTSLTGTITWSDNTKSEAPGQLTTGGGNQGSGDNANIVGTWSGDGYTFKFSADYTFIYDKGSGFDIDNSGTYTVSGNTITMMQGSTIYRTGTINGNTMITTAPAYGDMFNATLYKQ